MRAVSLATLRQRVRRRADVESNTDRFPDAEIDDNINEGIAAFIAERVRAGGEGTLEAETVFMTVDGIDAYSVPSDFLWLRAITIQHDGWEYDLRLFDELDAAMLTNMTGWLDCGTAFYRLRGDNLILKPMPTSAKRITMRYVTTSPTLTNPSDTVDGVIGLDEFAVAWAAQRVAMKDENWALIQQLDAVKAEALDRLRGIESNRDDFEPARFEDGARNRRRGWLGRRGFGPWR